MDLNLDAYVDHAELFALGMKLIGASRKLAEETIGAKPKGYVKACRNLGHYAVNKATAMRLRADGEIAGARQYEGICGCIWERLPDYARW